MLTFQRVALLPLLALGLSGCFGSNNDSSSNNPSPRTSTYEAKIVRTDMGIPHITASDFGSLGFGQAYAFAEDNLCVMLDDFVTIRGERARYFGADGSYRIEPNSSVADNVSSDFFWRSMLDDAAWQRTKAKTKPDFQQLVTGYVAGFNRYIAELKAGDHPGRHAACADGEWLLPITEADMYRRFVRLSILASSSVFVNEIANAQPPALPPSGGSGGSSPLDALLQLLSPILSLIQGTPLSALPIPIAQNEAPLSLRKQALAQAPGPFAELQQHDRFGSNMYGIGKDGSANGQSILFGNPHFPWRGTERLYISHNTIPGKLDIMGSSLYGVPAVLIGFNDRVAWSHTVSTAYRFTLYELKINPLNPTQYFYDGELRDMRAVPIDIQIKQPDGSLMTQSRTLYHSHFGPMMTLEAAGVPILPWTNVLAYTMRDANYENDRLINQFGTWNLAKNLDEFIEAHGAELGVPWVNTVATGPNGKAYYGDVTVVPHVTDAKVASCGTSPLALVVGQVAPGLPLLDGSRSDCEWGSDDDAPVPGIFGPSNLPSQQRDDYVTNCNDSYWLTNPKAPITGFSRIIGDENSPRTLRTRLCILQAERRLAGTDGLPGNRFTMQNLQSIVLNSQIYSAELARESVLNSLCTQPLLLGSSGPVAGADVTAACAALAGWDGTDNLDSTGAHVWREFWRLVSANPGGLPISVPIDTPLTSRWSTAFSSADPVNTPRTLNTNSLFVQLAFADAITAVKASGFAFDAKLGDIQHSGVGLRANGDKIPVFGGDSNAGAFTIATTDGPLATQGYPVIYGNSYIQTVTWDDNNQPIAEGFITYSQSSDPANPHYIDFTEAYAKKEWLRFPFTAAEVRAKAKSTITIRQ